MLSSLTNKFSLYVNNFKTFYFMTSNSFNTIIIPIFKHYFKNYYDICNSKSCVINCSCHSFDIPPCIMRVSFADYIHILPQGIFLFTAMLWCAKIKHFSKLRVFLKLFRTFLSKSNADGFENEVEVVKETALVLDIIKIHIDALLDGGVASAVRLPLARQTLRNTQAQFVFFRIGIILSQRTRTRSYKRHIPF